MGVRKWSLLFVAALAACQPRAQEPPRSQEPTQPPKAVARCGGTDSPAGFQSVLAGTDTVFYTARTRQSLHVKPGVEVKSQLDKEGNVQALTFLARDGSTTVNCACPGGCGSDPGQGHGCVVQYPPGGQDAELHRRLRRRQHVLRGLRVHGPALKSG